MLQSTSLDAQLTVGDTLALYAAVYPAPYRVSQVLEVVELADDVHTKVGALSGGQRRRVDLAIGIIGKPEVLFLDEPTTGLDPEARRRTWAAVEHLASTGTTVVLTTHYIDEADQLADRLIVLAGGRVVADTTPGDLRASLGLSTIRYPLPAGAPVADLPPCLASHIDPARRTLIVREADPAAALRVLVTWAERSRVDLAGLEVGPPSLEEAYLAAIGEPLSSEVCLP